MSPTVRCTVRFDRPTCLSSAVAFGDSAGGSDGGAWNFGFSKKHYDEHEAHASQLDGCAAASRVRCDAVAALMGAPRKPNFRGHCQWGEKMVEKQTWNGSRGGRVSRRTSSYNILGVSRHIRAYMPTEAMERPISDTHRHPLQSSSLPFTPVAPSSSCWIGPFDGPSVARDQTALEIVEFSGMSFPESAFRTNAQ